MSVVVNVSGAINWMIGTQRRNIQNVFADACVIHAIRTHTVLSIVQLVCVHNADNVEFSEQSVFRRKWFRHGFVCSTFWRIKFVIVFVTPYCAVHCNIRQADQLENCRCCRLLTHLHGKMVCVVCTHHPCTVIIADVSIVASTQFFLREINFRIKLILFRKFNPIDSFDSPSQTIRILDMGWWRVWGRMCCVSAAGRYCYWHQ